MSEADTTALARTAALLHEAGRVSDSITTGPQYAKAPWDDQPDTKKQQTIRLVTKMRGQTFEEFYRQHTIPLQFANQPVPDPNDLSNFFVRHARMLHAIVHGLLPDPVDKLTE